MEQFFVSDLRCHVNLRTKQSSTPTLLYFVISHKSKQYKVSTKIKVLPAHFINGRAVISRTMDQLTVQNNEAVNRRIIELENKFFALKDYLTEKATTDIKTAINVIFYGSEEPLRKKTDIKAETISATLYNSLRGRKLSDGSVNNYFIEIKAFCDFCGAHKKAVAEEIDDTFMKQYFQSVLEQKVTHKITGEEVCIGHNVAINKMRRLQSLFGFTNNATLKAIDFKSLYGSIKKDRVEENQVFISDEEVEKIIKANVKESDEKVRDVFVFQLEIGQRISDILPLLGKRLNICNDKLTIIQQKTQAKVTVPFTERVKEIINKYDGVLPNMCVSTIDHRLKHICKEAGLDETIVCSEHRGGTLYTYKVPKYKLISSHTARRSFVSNGLKTIDSKVLSKITGHTTDASFNKYNRLTSAEAVDIYLSKKK